MKLIHLSVALIILSGSFLFWGCQSIQPTAVAAPEVLAEFEMQGGVEHIVLSVKFHGEEYEFALDTGSTYTVFDDSFKDRLGRRFLWPKKAKGALGKELKIECFPAPDAYLGPFNLKHLVNIVATDPDKIIPDENRTHQGIIGMDFLLKYIVQIDFDNGKVTFFRGKKDIDLLFSPRPKKNKHPKWGESIPLKTKLFSRLRYIKGNILDNMGVDFMVDTAWSSVDSLKSRIFDKIYSQKNSNEESGDVKSSSTVLSSYDVINEIEKLSVGSLEYENHVFRRSDESVLGLAFLSRHLVTFDFPNKTMYLKRGKHFDEQPIFLSIIGIGCKVHGESHIVLEVDPNGAAYRKGIREKDILIKINDQDASSLGVVEFMAVVSQLAAQENGEITFTFKHGDEMITFPFGKRDTEANKN